MSQENFILAAVKSTPYLARLLLNLAWVYLTLGYRVRRMRNAFERQLMAQGMSKENARRLSASFEEMKDEIITAVKQSITLMSR